MRASRREDENLLSVVRACALEGEEVSRRWLIEGLWSAEAVGIVGGQPKCAKSWLALEMAVSVATGTPCLGHYDVEEKGGALVYLAEDSLRAVRERLEALTRCRRQSIESLEVHVIRETTLRLDLARDQIRLLKTLRALSPRILVLDPLVRLHRLDENSSHDVSGLLAYLRSLQRELDLSVVVVHHTKKNVSSGQSGGQGLRGSGDIHAWSDSSLYLRRRGEDLTLSIEHRSAPAPKPVVLRLVTEDPETPHLEVVGPGEREVHGQRSEDLGDRVVRLLEPGAPMTRSSLRQDLGVRNTRLGQVLDRLEREGKILHGPTGWCSARPPGTGGSDRSPFPTLGGEGNGTDPGSTVGPLELPGETKSHTAQERSPTDEG